MRNYPFLRQKICLMALIESVFARGSYDRTMSFQTISEETRLPLDEVEHLIMKALRCFLPLLYYFGYDNIDESG
jgi:26S proteasome regulatory subunit N9